MPVNIIRELYARFHQLNVELDELPELIEEKESKVLEILDRAPPWALWYELSWVKVLGLFLYLSNLDEMVIDASNSDDPQNFLFDYIAKNPNPLSDLELSEDEQALLLSLFMNVVNQLKSLSIFSQSLSELVSKAKSDDQAIFDAVLVDRSVVACPIIARRIQYAQLIGDESFMVSLSKAITHTRPRRPAEEYDDLRYMIEAADEMKVLESSTKEELFDIFANQLQIYNTEGKKDPLSGFKRLLERRDKRKAT